MIIKRVLRFKFTAYCTIRPKCHKNLCCPFIFIISVNILRLAKKTFNKIGTIVSKEVCTNSIIESNSYMLKSIGV